MRVWPMFGRTIVFLVSLMCGALPVSAADPSVHYVDVPEGRFASAAARLDALGALDAYAATGGEKPLLLHFHGGLVGGDAGKKSAERINETLPWPGAPLRNIAYPMYFIWHSGLLNFTDRPHYRYTGDELCQAKDFDASRSILGRSVDIYRGIDQRIESRKGHGYENALEQFIRAYHPINLPERWCGMKWSVARAFKTDQNEPGDVIPAGTEFVQKLVSVLESVDAKKRRVVLVAQSAGSIYVMALLNAVAAYTQDHPKERDDLAGKFDVILTAPAITFNDFAKKWPAAKPLVGNLRIFALTNAREYQDGLTDPAFGALHYIAPHYRHSLLYFVSGALEPVRDTPLVGMQRFWCSPVYQADADVQSVATALKGFGDFLVWSPTGTFRPGRNASARSHGMFSEDVMTWDSIASLVANSPWPRADPPMDPCTYYDDHNYDSI